METEQGLAPRKPEPDAVLDPLARALVRWPALSGSGQYVGFVGVYLLLMALGAPLVVRLLLAFMAAMTLHVFVQTLPTLFSRLGRQEQAARIAGAFAAAAGGELGAAHRLDEADFRLRQDEPAAAKEALAKVEAEKLPREHRLRYFQVQSALLMQTGDPATALVMNEAALALTEDPELARRPELLVHRALALYGLGRTEEALGTLAEVEEAALAPEAQAFLETVRGILRDED